MDCEYIELSVVGNLGIEYLITRVIEKSLDLTHQMNHNRVVTTPKNNSLTGSNRGFTLDDGLIKPLSEQATGEEGVENINPLELKQKKKKKCCIS